MKIDNILKLETDELIKIRKNKLIGTCLLGIIVLFLLGIKIYDYYQRNEFDSMMIIPIIFSPFFIFEFIKLIKINSELNRRKTNGKSN